MKKLTLAAALLLTSPAFAGEEAGLWKTQPDWNGNWFLVDVKPCGPLICGYITEMRDETGAEITDYEHIGRRMIWDMSANGDGTYSGGKVWGPALDKTLALKMEVREDSMIVKACFAGGMICKGQTWNRVQ